MSHPPDLKVVPLFDQAMAGDIVGSFRRAADSIAAETDADDRAIGVVTVLLRESGEIEFYGWGSIVDRFQAAGILQAGAIEALDV